MISQAEHQSRLSERRPCPTADSESIERYYHRNRPPTFEDQNVLAISFDPDLSGYTLPQTLIIYPNVETFHVDGATVDRISDRMWIIQSDLRDSAIRTALIEKLTTGFFSDEALSRCPEVVQGSPLSLRNTHRLERLKKKADMKDSRHYRLTTLSPVHGPHELLGENSPSTYNIAAFARLINAHASHSWGPARSIKTVEYAPRTTDRLNSYRSFSRQSFPASCHGNTTVILSSLDRAPDYFDLVSNETFPGALKDMRHLVVDSAIGAAAIGAAARSITNVSQGYSSPHLESVIFRLQDSRLDYTASDLISDVPMTSTTVEEADEGRLPGPIDLAEPLFGSVARVVFAASPRSEHLAHICEGANAAISLDREKRGLDGPQ